MSARLSSLLGRLNGIVASLKVKNLTVTGTETILGGVTFAGATAIGSSATDTLTVAASWTSFTAASIPYFASDKTLTQDNANLSYTAATKTLNAVAHLCIPTATGSLPAASSGAMVYDGTLNAFMFAVSGAYTAAVLAGAANVFTRGQTISPVLLTALTAGLPSAPVGSASAYMGAIATLAGTVGFTTAPQQGDYTTWYLDQATLTNPSSGTITNGTTLRIVGTPIAGANVTITNKYALWTSGNSRMDGGQIAVGSVFTSGARLTIDQLGRGGSASTAIGSLATPAGTVAFVTSPQTGDFYTWQVDIATLTNPSIGTIPNAATLRVAGPPVASTNVTITNPYSVWVASGVSRFDNNISIQGGVANNARLTVNPGNNTGISSARYVLSVPTATTTFGTNPQIGDTSAAFFGIQTLINPSIGTIPNAATVRIEGAMVASTNVTITNNYALWVQAGLTLLAGGLTVTGAAFTLTDQNMVLGTATGTQFGTATNQKLGFWGATPIVRGSAFTQSYATASHTLDSFDPATVTATTVTPTGFANGTEFNNFKNTVQSMKQVLNGVIDDLQAVGLLA